ncbi:general transcription factor II-I repeat domain-containing protein 2-like [Homarus americanus]|uniref:general transcription factor II-I repeat domain-containing protein 2-like n=1 Tax=Homarus americanus TaxID=6706 RepID=UPI001C470175|nr:general transcription factor II-I repeat domain-containing protein 2-like [Homarus americanus]
MKSDPKFPEFLLIHCIIHRQHLAARYFRYENVMKFVLDIVKFIRSNGKTHRQLKNFNEELELEDNPNDVSFYCIVRWLSTSNVLNGFVDLLDPLTTFLEERKRAYPQLENDEWMQDLVFLTDIMKPLQTLNLALQGKEKIISYLTQKIFSFQNKIRVFQRNTLSRNFSHFPHLKRRVNRFPDIEIKDHKLEEYKDKLQGLLDNFLARFHYLQKLKPCFTFLINPFMVNVINGGCPILEPLVTESAAVEMELMEFQEDLGLKMIHKSQSTVEFWKQVPETK